MPAGFYERTDRMRDNIRAAAIRRGVVGFLKPVRAYVVTCGGAPVYTGRIKREAVHCYQRYCRWSKAEWGKAAGQSVTLTIDGEISQHYTP